MKITFIEPKLTWPLRQTYLRPHQTLGEMQYPGDDDSTTRHFGIGPEGELLGVASLYLEALAERPDARGWRLRGMAVATPSRGQGLGSRLVHACASYAKREGGDLIWCNAREVALPFYHGLGFETLRGPFELPGIGPHFLLALRIRPVAV